LLFRRFVDLSLSQSVPDHITLWNFCHKPEAQALQSIFLEEVSQQLSEQDLHIENGAISIVDTSVIKAHHNRPYKGVDGKKTRDSEADYNVKTRSDGKK
jgi:IS5 family transposase